jgi:hypothetical protein
MRIEEMLNSLKNDISLSILKEMTPRQTYEVILKKFLRLKNSGKKKNYYLFRKLERAGVIIFPLFFFNPFSKMLK